MKRILTTIAVTIFSICAFAQDFPAGMRNEVASMEQDQYEYSLFSYKDQDGAFGFYLGLSTSFRILETIDERNDSNSSLDHIDEICIYMGSTPDEAAASLDALLELFEEPVGTVKEFNARIPRGQRLGDDCTVNSVIVKRFLQGKRLLFTYASGRHVAETDLTKSAVKSLRFSFSINRKLHPDD